MRIAIWTLLLVSILGVGLGLREWLLLEEIEAQKIEFRTQVISSVKQAADLGRLQQIQKPAFVHGRFLEPVILTASRLIVPGATQHHILEWRRELHGVLNDQIYLRQVTLSEEVTAELKKIQESEEPGVERLQKIVELSQNFLDGSSRLDHFQNELKILQDSNRQADEAKLKSLKAAGKTALSELRGQLRKLRGNALADYLTSPKYQRDVEEPVLGVIFDIKNAELRKKAWKEFSEQRSKIYKVRPKAIAKASEKKVNPAGAAVAELLKQEFEKELERERAKAHVNIPLAQSPLDAKSVSKDIEVLELGQ